MEFIAIPVIVGICIYGVYSIFELFARRKERMAIIEKMNGHSPGAGKIGKIEFSTKFSSLKWACLLLGIGAGLLLGFFLSNHYIPYEGGRVQWEQRELTSIIYGASVLICGGIGMLSAFLVEYHLSKRDEK